MTVNISTDDSGNPTAVLVTAGTGYAQGDKVVFDDPASVGDALTVTVLDPYTAPVISTELLSPVTHDSIGDSGNLTLSAPEIEIEPGTQLLADIINSNGTTYTGGTIDIVAEAALTYSYSLSDLSPWQVHVANATITIDDAVLTGATIDISASATTNSFAGYDVFGQGWENVIAGQTVGEETNPNDTTLTFADGPGGNS